MIVKAEENDAVTEPSSPSEDADLTADEPAAVQENVTVKSAGTYNIEYVDDTEFFGRSYPPDGDYMTGHWPENTTAASGEVVSLPPIIPGPFPVEKLFGEGYVTYTWEWYTVVPRGYSNTSTDNILDTGTGTFVMPESDVLVKGRWVYNDSIQIFP